MGTWVYAENEKPQVVVPPTQQEPKPVPEQKKLADTGVNIGFGIVGFMVVSLLAGLGTLILRKYKV